MSIKEIIDKLYTNEVVFMYDFALLCSGLQNRARRLRNKTLFPKYSIIRVKPWVHCSITWAILEHENSNQTPGYQLSFLSYMKWSCSLVEKIAEMILSSWARKTSMQVSIADAKYLCMQYNLYANILWHQVVFKYFQVRP